MARINSRTLFLTTSPRSPEKMVPEINLLIQNFAGKDWDEKTQCSFMEVLREEDFYNGTGDNDPAFSARDRINRAPKALGFVKISPKIFLTPAGQSLLTSRRKNEVFLRQMLKFQIPSPYHKPSSKAAHFCVKPYLEILRLIRHLGILKFDELQIFGMQMTDYHQFDKIVNKINTFRQSRAEYVGSYRKFKTEYLQNELKRIYADRIKNGEIKTRESNDNSLPKFLQTQANNTRDYADACFRYLRATGLVNVSHVGKSLSIVPEFLEDVDFILENVEREPVFIDDEKEYSAYLGNAEIPMLLTDDRPRLINKIHSEFPTCKIDQGQDIEKLKDLYNDLVEKRKEFSIKKQIGEIKGHRQYDDIQNLYEQIEGKNLYDAPLMLEWNTWRAMTMLDGGDIQANLNFDDFGKQLSTASGNMPDIVCDYGDFILSVEVTMMSAQRQFEAECEPISRHLGKLKISTGKPSYCLFIAPTINASTIAFCYMLHKTNVAFYGGKSVILPLTLKVFRKMLEDSYKADYIPSPSQVKHLFEFSEEIIDTCLTEEEWYSRITDAAIKWLE